MLTGSNSIFSIYLGYRTIHSTWIVDALDHRRFPSESHCERYYDTFQWFDLWISICSLPICLNEITTYHKKWPPITKFEILLREDSPFMRISNIFPDGDKDEDLVHDLRVHGTRENRNKSYSYRVQFGSFVLSSVYHVCWKWDSISVVLPTHLNVLLELTCNVCSLEFGLIGTTCPLETTIWIALPWFISTSLDQMLMSRWHFIWSIVTVVRMKYTMSAPNIKKDLILIDCMGTIVGQEKNPRLVKNSDF
jgi:hypothetical protein